MILSGGGIYNMLQYNMSLYIIYNNYKLIYDYNYKEGREQELRYLNNHSGRRINT